MAQPTAEITSPTMGQPGAWYKQLTGYHWLVLIVCTLAWSFDCLNQQFFNLARVPAMADLLNVAPDDAWVSRFGGYATSALMIGWATGGIIFGVMADRVGRAKTLVTMILAYSMFTGLCGLTQSPWQYVASTFVTGMGCGGIFPIACTLVAESLPGAVRSSALGMLQAFSAVGNVSAGLLWLGVLELRSRGFIHTDWRWLFSIGIVPALLSIIVMRRVREPDAWLHANASAKAGLSKSGSIAELFGDPRWRRRAICGMLLAASGVIGLWGIGVFSPDLTQSVIGKSFDEAQRAKGEPERDLQFVAQVMSSPEALKQADVAVKARDLLEPNPKYKDTQAIYQALFSFPSNSQPVSSAQILADLDLGFKVASLNLQVPAQTSEEHDRRAALLKQAEASLSSAPSVSDQMDRILSRQNARAISSRRWGAVALIMFNAGAFFGIYLFAYFTQFLGRRLTFAISFVAAGCATAAAFTFMSKPSDLFWMVPLMGAAQLSLFGGYAIYFPELFPTRLRSTGSSFCYNVARYVAATGPFTISYLKTDVFKGTAEPFRNAGVAMCSCFLVGLIALIFAPETKGQPLPE